MALLHLVLAVYGMSDPILLAASRLELRAGSRLLASNLEFELTAGQEMVVQGPSGAGKSTLLRALARLDPVHGALFFRGVPLTKIAAPVWRRKVALVPAGGGLGTLGTVGERLARPFTFDTADRSFDPEAARLEMDGLGLNDVPMERPIGQLSDGQRQRLALSRAFLVNPDVLLADEPTSHLDPASTELVMNRFFGFISKGRAIIWVSHEPNLTSNPHRRFFALKGI